MILNSDKCHIPNLAFNELFPDFSLQDTTIENANKSKILEIVIENKLNFRSNLKTKYRNTNQKLNSAPKILKLTIIKQREKQFILSLNLNSLNVL